MSSPHSLVDVDPNQVRFTQSSIASHFSDKHGKGTSLSDASNQLKSGELTPSDFPPIRVSKDASGVMQSHDNRRLWVYREAGMTNVKAEVVSKPPSYKGAAPAASRHASFSPK
ncbi:hypothetical protein KI387_020887, partial [Taxus chinensis]